MAKKNPVVPAVDSTSLRANGLERVVTNSDGTQQVQRLCYNGLVGTTVQYAPYLLTFVNAATNGKAHAIAATATLAVYQKVVVAQEAIATTGYVWCTISGYCTCLVDGTTDVAASDYLKTNGSTASLIKDATTRTTSGVGIALAARTTDSAGALSIFLFEDNALIA